MSTADKIEFVNRLSAAGLPVIEVSAFVSPKWVPQMADAAEVFAGIARRPGDRYTALVPNLAGLDRAIAAGVDRDRGLRRVTETFSRKNINQSIDESLAAYEQVCDRARAAGLRVRGYLSTAFGCPFEGDGRAGARRRRRRAAARPRRVRGGGQRHDRHRASGPGAARARRGAGARAGRQVALHFHDTRGTALANVLASLPVRHRDVRRVEPAGSAAVRTRPAPPATWPPTISIYMLDGLGIETGVSLAALSEASAFIASKIDHRLPSRYAQAAAANAKSPTKLSAVVRCLRILSTSSHGIMLMAS